MQNVCHMMAPINMTHLLAFIYVLAQLCTLNCDQPIEPLVLTATGGAGLCSKNEAMCADGQCISREYVCDGDSDCSDSSDELNCIHYCEPNQFQCQNNRCILKTWRCDSDNDCEDNSDETFCEPAALGSPCRYDEYKCISGDQCIPRSYQCDGEFDCQDKTDEIGCSAPTVVSPPPETVSVAEGQTVNISCRAVGTPTPLISWRLNWNHIPHPPRVTVTSVDGFGTVTIRDAKVSDQGAWSCEAINSKDSVLAAHDCLLDVKPKHAVCQSPSFNDLAQNPSECLRCFCFGVSETCHSSVLRVVNLGVQSQLTVIPLIRDPNGSYIDMSRQYPPNQNAVTFNSNTREYSIRSDVMPATTPDDVFFYWNLPSEVLGNRLASYGGYIRYTIRYREPYLPKAPKIPDVILKGNGIHLYHYFNNGYNTKTDTNIKIRFWEGEWHKHDMSARSPPLFSATTREDIMMALQNIDYIYIKATYDEQIIDSSILNIEIDDGVLTNTSSELAVFVEKCLCSDGYTGSSCEYCSPGYIRELSGRYLGRCIAPSISCPCNHHSNDCDRRTHECFNCQHNTEGDHCERCKRGFYGTATHGREDSCRPCPCPQITPSHHLNNLWLSGFPQEWYSPTCHMDDREGDVICDSCPIGFEGNRCERCAPGYTGNPADGEQCKQQGSEPTIRVNIDEPKAQRVPIGSVVTFRCTGVSQKSDITYNLVWTKEGGSLPPRASETSGILTIVDVKPEYSGTYICTGSDLHSVAQDHATLVVETNTQPSVPRVRIEPYYQEVNVGDLVEFKCTADGYPPPQLKWTGGRNNIMNPSATFNNGVFRIESVRKSDESEYFCHSTNSVGSDFLRTILFVRGYKRPDVGTKPQVTISPVHYEAKRGETVKFDCKAGPTQTSDLKWSYSGGELPHDSRQFGGLLILARVTEAHQGVYTCTARNAYGTTEAQARLMMESGMAIPTARIEPERQTIVQGHNGELRCVTSGSPSPTISWQKIGGDSVPLRHKTDGELLIIEKAVIEDRGLYVCRVDNREGSAQSSAIVEIERREIPAIEIYPESSQTVVRGGSALFQCRVTAGIPTPLVDWRRSDGSLFTPNTELLDGVLRFNRVTGDEDGVYICTAENMAGRVTAQGVLKIHGVPTVKILQSTPYRVRPNEKVRLECEASGELKPNLIWRRVSHQQYSGAPTFIASTERDGIAVIEITNVTDTDAGDYVCTSTSPFGTSEERIHLIVEDDLVGTVVPHIVVEDRVVTVAAGNRAAMRCFVRGTTRPVELNWSRVGNQSLPLSSRVENGILYIDDVKPQDSGEYQCLGVVDGRTVLFEARARLAVVAPPRVHLQPIRQKSRPGDTVTIDCNASGDQPITIDWSRIGGALPAGVYAHSGRLELRGIQLSDAGRYLCTAVNAGGKAEGVAELIVDHSDYEHVVPKQETTFVGSNIELKCQFGGSPAPTISWLKDSNESIGLLDNAREVNNDLWIRSVRLENAGRYICTAMSSEGVFLSRDFVILNVREKQCEQNQFRCNDGNCIDIRYHCNQKYDCPDLSDEYNCVSPAIEVKIVANKDRIYVGDYLTIECQVSGQPLAPVQWKAMSQSGPFASNMVVRDSTLIVNGVKPENGGIYRCTVDTYAGIYNSDYVLAIEEMPTIGHDEVETKSAPIGSTIVMDCQTTLELPVRYSWAKQGGPLPPEAIVDEEGVLTIRGLIGQHSGTYICTAKNDYVTIDIPTIVVVTGVVPYFPQTPLSYMVRPTLPDAYLTFDVEISFRPEDRNGLILYNGQKQNTGDFISLGLTDGRVELRYDLGAGPAILMSDKPIEMKSWHKVKFSRNEKDGVLQIDDEMPVKGTAPGDKIGLDLLEPLYIGGVPDFSQISKQNGFNKGFVGCISLFKVGTVTHELVNEAEAHSVRTCETCLANTCANQGVCQETSLTEWGYKCVCTAGFSGHNCEKTGDSCFPGVCGSGRCANRINGGFECFCPFGKSGQKCEKNIVIVEPELSNDAFIAYPTPKDTLNKMSLKMKVKPKALDEGLLVYSSQNHMGNGDFISLTIKNGSVEFQFDTGSGPALLKSPQKLETNEWVTILAERDLRKGSLRVGNSPAVFGESPGRTRGLNLRLPLYVGGYDKQQVKIAPFVGITHGFYGCVGHIEVNSNPINLITSVIDAANVADCGSESPCQRFPCLNGGKCTDIDRNDYQCLCHPNFTGKNCNQMVGVCELTTPCRNGAKCRNIDMSYRCLCPIGFKGNTCDEAEDFDDPRAVRLLGDGFFTLSSHLLPHSSSLADEVIRFVISTQEDEGLIFFHGQTPDTNGVGRDFMAIALSEGYIDFSFELGSGLARIRSTVRVNDGIKHKVVIKRKGKEGSVIIDETHTTYGESTGSLQSLNASGDIYIGGLPDYALMSGNRFTGFIGCITDIEIGNSGAIDVDSQSKSAQNLLNCDELTSSGFNF